ncbi:ABC transporter ATP-binding protein [Erysipelothrix sp. HDW6C]|uniref:ATP-binding cassette domain-containing protein n=1 Tax=Erysipelothrix sp. HDW6C TaxID=2714930 RepID=UPI00140A980B|nr:ABC transporter ATP-binding protein [Erysipelothrix sp. HDW6C]QIK70817.1 ABC transporter ATP-binding protein [Erysipelothrix sp. HDW6C]
MITIKNLHVSYRDFKALQIDKEIIINANDRVGVIGSNGAGKSTLIKACLGLLPYEGNIIATIKPEEMAVHMQSNEYVETMSTKSVMEAILNTSIKDNTKLQELITFFNFDASLKKKYKELSGGQKQRFTLIMVLMQDAPITFFDEVTTGLDFETRQALMKKITEWYQGKDAAILFVTHYYEELEQLTNKLLILNQGKVVAYGHRDELFRHYCGHSVITFKARPEEMSFIGDFKTILAPNDTTAIACASKEEEMRVIAYLNTQEINFKRSDNDVEILTMNAIGGTH